VSLLALAGVSQVTGRNASSAPEPRSLFLPMVGSTVASSAVVHVRARSATNGGFDSSWYGDYVDQAVVDEMMVRGLCRLTNCDSVAAAWDTLTPAYEPGQKFAVKINLNNARCDDADRSIDALMQPINALIGTMVAAGIREEDVWVYDATRPMPARLYAKRRYTKARYLATSCADGVASFTHVDPSLRVSFASSAFVVERWLTDVLYQATYVINMPILKRHGTHPVTLGFKNHFGSLSNLGGTGIDNPHVFINPNREEYRSDWSPLVDINANPNLAGKTVLTVADGLFGASSAGAVPTRWVTFGNEAPSSLFFSRDRVAMDCVLCDLLRAEWGLDVAAYDYMKLAAARGLGTFESGDPWGSGYRQIQYVKLNI
jgi:hypothetical protein